MTWALSSLWLKLATVTAAYIFTSGSVARHMSTIILTQTGSLIMSWWFCSSYDAMLNAKAPLRAISQSTAPSFNAKCRSAGMIPSQTLSNRWLVTFGPSFRRVARSAHCRRCLMIDRRLVLAGGTNSSTWPSMLSSTSVSPSTSNLRRPFS